MAQKILAAGGVVVNEDGDVLFEFRRGKWDLPKGKLDEGETLEECAVREIAEETGVAVTLGKLIDSTTHFYTERGTPVEKQTYWYHMQATKDQPLMPQAEEDITELRWVAKKELPEYMENTYDNIVEILRKAFPDL